MAIPEAMPLPSEFEKYLNGQPINDELRQLRDGPQLVPASESKKRAPLQEDSDRITRADMAALREFRNSDAWPVLAKLVKISVQEREKAATILSQEDPLAKGHEVAQAWAYVKMLKSLWLELVLRVESAAANVEREEA